MNTITSINWKNYILCFLLILLISLAGFFWAFDYYFIAEDWWNLWVISNPKLNYLIFQTDLFANHPIGTYMQILMVHFFGFNSYLWQISGYTFKVLNALAVILMVWGMTNSKKAALYSGLIFAASVGGLESYLWVGRQSSVPILLFLAIGFYFWAKSFPEKLLSKKYMIALVFFLLAIFGEPGRGIISFALCIIWDIVETQKYSKKSISKIISRNGFFISMCLSLLLIFWRGHVLNSTSSNYQESINYIVNNSLPVAKGFLTSIGNFVSGGFIPTLDIFALSHPSDVAFRYGVLFVMVILYFLWRSFAINSVYSKQTLFFLLWIPIAFFPSWFITQYFIEPHKIAGVTHHYFTLSALGFSAALGCFLSRFNKAVGIILLTAVIISNIAQSNRILQQEWNHRSATIVKLAWDKIDREVPTGVGNNSIILFSGDDPLVSDLDASDAIPFAIKRGIANPVDMPIQTVVGQEALQKILCEDKVPYTTAVREQAISKKRIPLSRLFAWEVNDGIITNVSERERKKLSSELKCNYIL